MKLSKINKDMKKIYCAPTSTIYNVDNVTPIAASPTSDNLKLNLEQSHSDLDDSLNPEDNYFTKGNKTWDNEW